jgi:DNA-binding response OmpR family regulator
MCQQGFSVMEAASVSEAYDLMLNFPADLVLLDISLPEVDGTDFYDIATVFCKRAKFIVTSVYPLADQRRLVPGADDYYDKSDSLAVLVGKVRRLASSMVPE